MRLEIACYPMFRDDNIYRYTPHPNNKGAPMTSDETWRNRIKNTNNPIMKNLTPTKPAHQKPSYMYSEKLALRKLIHTSGEPFYQSLADIDDLQNIAGEFMSLNEDWCILYPKTYGYDDRTKTGFSQNQKAFLERVASIIRTPTKEQP
jgi:hypothetical protein